MADPTETKPFVDQVKEAVQQAWADHKSMPGKALKLIDDAGKDPEAAKLLKGAIDRYKVRVESIEKDSADKFEYMNKTLLPPQGSTARNFKPDAKTTAKAVGLAKKLATDTKSTLKTLRTEFQKEITEAETLAIKAKKLLDQRKSGTDAAKDTASAGVDAVSAAKDATLDFKSILTVVAKILLFLDTAVGGIDGLVKKRNDFTKHYGSATMKLLRHGIGTYQKKQLKDMKDKADTKKNLKDRVQWENLARARVKEIKEKVVKFDTLAAEIAKEGAKSYETGDLKLKDAWAQYEAIQKKFIEHNSKYAKRIPDLQKKMAAQLSAEKEKMFKKYQEKRKSLDKIKEFMDLPKTQAGKRKEYLDAITELEKEIGESEKVTVQFQRAAA